MKSISAPGRPLCCLTLIVMGVVAGSEITADPVQAGERYAFLVGVQTYVRPELRPLRFSDNDIGTLAQLLQERGYRSGNLLTLSQTRATRDVRFTPFRENIFTELRLFARLMQPEDSLVVALAGHGLQFRGEESVYFCPCDADISRRTSLIAIEDLYELLRTECRARNIVLLIDACRNDPLSNAARDRAEVTLETATRPQEIPVPRGMASFFSCSPGEQAFESPTLKHGVFFHHVIDGIRGSADLDSNGEITLTELHASITGKVQKFAFREFRAAQTPQLSGKVSGVFSVGIVQNSPTTAVTDADAADHPDDLPAGIESDGNVAGAATPADSADLSGPGIAAPAARGSLVNSTATAPAPSGAASLLPTSTVGHIERPPVAPGTIPVATLGFGSPRKMLAFLNDAESLFERSTVRALSAPLAALESHLDDQSACGLFLDTDGSSSAPLVSGIFHLRDPVAFRAALDTVPAVADTGVHQLLLGGKPVHVREHQGWLLFSTDRISETQITLQDDPAGYVATPKAGSDMQITLFTQNIPAGWRNDVRNALLRHLVRRLAGGRTTAITNIRYDRAALAKLVRTANLLMEQAGRIEVSGRVDETAGGVEHHVNIQAVPRTELAALLEGQPKTKPSPPIRNQHNCRTGLKCQVPGRCDH